MKRTWICINNDKMQNKWKRERKKNTTNQHATVATITNTQFSCHKLEFIHDVYSLKFFCFSFCSFFSRCTRSYLFQTIQIISCNLTGYQINITTAVSSVDNRLYYCGGGGASAAFFNFFVMLTTSNDNI